MVQEGDRAWVVRGLSPLRCSTQKITKVFQARKTMVSLPRGPSLPVRTEVHLQTLRCPIQSLGEGQGFSRLSGHIFLCHKELSEGLKTTTTSCVVQSSSLRAASSDPRAHGLSPQHAWSPEEEETPGSLLCARKEAKAVALHELTTLTSLGRQGCCWARQCLA